MGRTPYLISAQELQELYEEFSKAADLSTGQKLCLVDVREVEEHQEGHIQGCVLIPLGEIVARGPEELDPDRAIVLYCAHGIRSLQALMALKSAGFTQLRSLDGGIEAWIEAGGKTIV